MLQYLLKYKKILSCKLYYFVFCCQIDSYFTLNDGKTGIFTRYSNKEHVNLNLYTPIVIDRPTIFRAVDYERESIPQNERRCYYLSAFYD